MFFFSWLLLGKWIHTYKNSHNISNVCVRVLAISQCFAHFQGSMYWCTLISFIASHFVSILILCGTRRVGATGIVNPIGWLSTNHLAEEFLCSFLKLFICERIYEWIKTTVHVDGHDGEMGEVTVKVDTKPCKKTTGYNKSDVKRRCTFGCLDQYMCTRLRLWNSRYCEAV